MSGFMLKKVITLVYILKCVILMRKKKAHE
jgi:hypothetical protein